MTNWTPDGPNCRQCGRHDYALHYAEPQLSNPFARCSAHDDCPLATKPLAPQERWAPVPKWTDERPAVPGFYWVRDVCNRSKPAVVYAFMRADELVFAYPADATTHSLRDAPRNYAPLEWAGPLTPPSEAP